MEQKLVTYREVPTVINNKGITLIELIIVVSILSIMTGIVGLSISIVSSADTTNTAERIDQLLERVKSETMSKANSSYLVVYKDLSADNPGYYAGITTSPDTFVKNTDRDENIGSLRINIEYVISSSSTKIENQKIFLTFNRSSGAFEQAQIQHASEAPSEIGLISEIKITGGKAISIMLVSDTGNHYIE